MIFCKELNKDFDSKSDMFKALKDNKDFIISAKKSLIQKSIDKGLGVQAISIDVNKLDLTTKGILKDNNYYYIAVNTTRVLDSHGDLHVKGIWNKTIKDQQGKNYLLTDHKMEMQNVVVKKENVEMLLAEIPFSSVGKSYPGNTQALIYKVAKTDVINPLAKDWLDSGSFIEASVRMQYVTIDLALNSQSKSDKAEFKVYNDYIDEIANKSEFDSIDYFWVVKEAKNLLESSLVLNGSNSATGLLDNKNIAPFDNTQKDEPSADDTQIITDKVSSNNLYKFYKNL